MEEPRLIDLLVGLVRLDVDAMRAYDQALDNVRDAHTFERLTLFRKDHERHVDELSTLIRNRGGTPPQRAADLKGFLIEGFTTIRSATGTGGALRAMRMNELLTNKRYIDALSADLPAEVRVVVQRNMDDERRHLEFIEQAIVRPAMA